MGIRKEDVESYAKIAQINLDKQEDIYQVYMDNLYPYLDGSSLYKVYKAVRTNILMGGNNSEGEVVNLGVNLVGVESTGTNVYISPDRDMRDISKEKFLNLVKYTIRGLMRWSYKESYNEDNELQYYHDTGEILVEIIKQIISGLDYICRSIRYIEEEDVQAVYRYIIKYHEETLQEEDEQEFNKESENEYEFFIMRVVFSIYRQLGEEVGE